MGKNKGFALIFILFILTALAWFTIQSTQYLAARAYKNTLIFEFSQALQVADFGLTWARNEVIKNNRCFYNSPNMSDADSSMKNYQLNILCEEKGNTLTVMVEVLRDKQKDHYPISPIVQRKIEAVFLKKEGRFFLKKRTLIN